MAEGTMKANVMPPHKAYSQLGVRAAFSGISCGLKPVPAKWRYLIPHPQGASQSRSERTPSGTMTQTVGRNGGGIEF